MGASQLWAKLTDKEEDGIVAFLGTLKRKPSGQSTSCAGRIFGPRGKISILTTALRKSRNQADNDQFRTGPLR